MSLKRYYVESLDTSFNKYKNVLEIHITYITDVPKEAIPYTHPVINPDHYLSNGLVWGVYFPEYEKKTVLYDKNTMYLSLYTERGSYMGDIIIDE